MTVAPYGSWASPITSESIVAGTIRLSGGTVDGGAVAWLESRPAEAGRYVVVRREVDGSTRDLTPAPFNVRTRVHEYGGGSFTFVDRTLFFANYADQRLYRLDADTDPVPLSPALDLRYADFAADLARNRLVCVREDHRPGDQDAVNAIAAVDTAGGSVDGGGTVLVAGNDFYANPRLSPDGAQLAWLTWNHPNMPWDGTELWVGHLAGDGTIADARLVAGGAEESIFQPEWSPDGVLTFVSDRTGWWNLYQDRAGEIVPLCPMEAEFGLPQWNFGISTYGFAAADRIICAYTQHGTWHIGDLALPAGRLTPVPTPFTVATGITVHDGIVVFEAASPTSALAVYRHDLATGDTEAVRSSSSVELDPAYVSMPEAIEFPTEGGLSAHGFFYPPTNPAFSGPDGERPPLVVISHGGPTGATSTELDLDLQYWTSRGFALLDVNYGGSTGYGRAYRQRLNDTWGVTDVDDCVNGARFLAARGSVDGDRLAIRGWSASGFTTLAALTFRDVFKAGASHFGISDLEAMAADTHKFESRYLDRLIAPYPERKDVWMERSPIHDVDRIGAPLILFQGLEDKVVPPNQAQMMYDAVAAKGLPVALVMFEGEQHGFRRAENIRRALDGELFFLSRVFGFTPADAIDPVPIANM